MRLRETVVTALAVPALLVATASPATAADVLVVNETDARTVGEADAEVVVVRNGKVHSVNRAQAVSRRCTDCRTGALALQLVVVAGRARSVAPTNVAAAVNEECTRCYTVADARQVVVSAPSGSRLSSDGKQLLAELDQSADAVLAELLASQAEPETIDRAVDALEDELRELAKEVRRGRP